jgi:spore germination protein
VSRINRKIKVTIILFTIIPLIFCGCWDQKRFEQIGFITIISIESSPDGDMKLTYAEPVTDPSTKVRGELLDTTAGLLREGRENLRRKSAKAIEAGEIQLIMYSKEYAEKGFINETNEVFERDPTNPALAWVVVVDGSSTELIHKAEELQDKPRPSAYITQLLERSAKSGYTVETRVYKYDLIHWAPGIDNVTPIIKYVPGAVMVEGSALFSKGKMVGSINPKQNALLLAMMGKLKNTSYTSVTVGMPEDVEGPKHGIASLILQRNRKIKINIIDNKPVVDIYMNLYGYIDEYKWNNFKNEENVKKVSKHIQNEFEKENQSLIKYMQELDSDPIGIGDMIRAKHNKYWKSVDWDKVYPQAKISAHVNLEIVQYGGIQ